MSTRFGLTAQQRQLFDFVHSEITGGRRAPSFEEIKAHLGLSSKSHVHRLVEALVERGWLIRLPNRARSLALPETLAADATERVAEAPLQVTIPPRLAGRLAEFCADRRRSAGDVVQEALNAHLRWPS